jgi:hypothetical protein
MARTARTDARGHSALALLLAGLTAAGSALGAFSAYAQSGSPGTPAPADSTALLAQAAESGTSSPSIRGGPAPPAAPKGAQVLEPGSGFTLRRVANPRYRGPSPIGALLARPLGTLIGSEFARARVTYRESGPVLRSTDWEVIAGRERGARSRLEVWASGTSSTGYDQLRMLRLTSVRRLLEWSLGDVAVQPIGTLPWIQRLRGAQITHVLPRGSDWRLLGGIVPTFTHGVTPSTGLASILVDHLPIENGAFSLGLMGFARRAPSPGGGGLANPDSLPGGGGAALYAARVASRYGDVGATYMLQAHDLDGSTALAGLQALEWTLSRPAIVASVRDQIGTRNARQPGTERLSAAPSHEGRMSAQVRMLQGRAEMHLAGLTSAGSDVAIAAQTAQAGVSGNLGTSGWYSGLDFSWNRRAPLFADERRVSLQTGRVSDRGSVVLMRVERNADNLGRDQVLFTGEASASPLPGLRLALEPRLDWQASRFERAIFSARLGWPLFHSSARMNASLTLTSTRTQGFRNELSEASVSLSFAPRMHDRATFEARRYEENGTRSFEATGSYDLLASLYSSPAGALNAQRTGTLIVTIVRADSASGVPDALVSLDGKEFRFTDSEGVARFTNTPPGSHVVSVVERSLPASQRVVGAATAFVTIERGRTPEPVRFEIARPVRRVRF